MISFLNRRVLRSRVLGGRICPFLFESTTDRFPIVTHALTQNAMTPGGFGSLDRRATSAFVGPIFWRFVQVSLVCLENCLSLEINIAARPPSFSKTPHMARCSLIFRTAFPLAVELSCTFSWSWALSSLFARCFSSKRLQKQV